jgi:hypothetical protein
MSDSKELQEIAALKEEFKSSVLSSKKLGNDRYTYSKNKKSQADGAFANVVVIKDTAKDISYTISVNVTAVESKGEEQWTSDEGMPELQAAVTAFLLSIHEEL